MRGSSIGVTASALALAVAIAAVVTSAPAPATGAMNDVVVAGQNLTVDGSTTSVELQCVAIKTCKGTVALRIGKREGKAKRYAVAAGTSGVVGVALTSKQAQVVPASGSIAGTLLLAQKKPHKLKVRRYAVALQRAVATPTPSSTQNPTPTPSTPPAPTIPDPPVGPASYAFSDRNWSPTSYDSCPAALHRSYSVVGPDGKVYPTWHPPVVVNPLTDEPCTFGHEHGDDPRASDIYLWVTDFLDANPETSRGIPFGYVSEALTTYAASTGAQYAGITRHEDNVGHKIIVLNDVRLTTQDPRGFLRDTNGDPVTCDFLLKVHQGSHSADALINNAHELLYAAKCSDGTALITSTMARFGNANEFNRSCAPSTLVPTSGSNLPAGTGQRRIPDIGCVNDFVYVPDTQSSGVWSLYEVWAVKDDLVASDGSTLASFDPWFGVRNPSRAANTVPTTVFDLFQTVDGSQANGEHSHGPPWDGAKGLDLAKQNPASPFDGAQRDYYLHRTLVDNDGGPTTWYTNPWGEKGTSDVPAADAGLVKQWISATDNSSYPNLERREFDLERDYGNGNGVHSPN